MTMPETDTPSSSTPRPPRMFPNVPLIGDLTGAELQKTLEDIGQVAPPAVSGSPKRAGWWTGTGAWKYTTHQFGFIPASSKSGAKNIISVGEIEKKDTDLQ